ncbi:MAG: hypothetical protein IJ048_06385 [Clostridia bacterium]|nr:hypothetical protein [Clostridia bacterium]
MRLDALWNYMQYDMEADRFESGMRNSPNRLKLLKQRDFLLEQQNNMKKVESNVAAMSDRLEAVRDEADRLQGVLAKLLDELKEHQPETMDEIQKQLSAAQKLENTLQHYEQELAKMRKESEQFDRMQRDIRTKAARTKAEYDELKGQYENEFKDAQAKLAELKARAEAEGKAIDPAMMAHYRQVKQHAMPPMAKINGDRCGGCNMSLPAATRDRLNAGNDIVECDNCGRILFAPSEG